MQSSAMSRQTGPEMRHPVPHGTYFGVPVSVRASALATPLSVHGATLAKDDSGNDVR